jgi:hypothetical protein
MLFLTSPSDRSRTKDENITCSRLSIIRVTSQSESVKPTNKGVPLNCNVSQTELYPGHTKVSFLFLSNGFHGVFSYTRKQDQQQRKYQDGYESNIRGYQLTDGTKWHQLIKPWINLIPNLPTFEGLSTLIFFNKKGEIINFKKRIIRNNPKVTHGGDEY